jgi:hypothetical protein
MNIQSDINNYYKIFHNCRKIPTSFTADNLADNIRRALNRNYNDEEYTITEDQGTQHDDEFIKTFIITFYPEDDDDFHIHFNYDTYHISSDYIVEVAFSEKNGNKFIRLFDQGNSRTRFCRNVLVAIKFWFMDAEVMYMSREPLLLFMTGAINNYNNFTTENINQINENKKETKLRCVLENPMYQREVLEYICHV